MAKIDLVCYREHVAKDKGKTPRKNPAAMALVRARLAKLSPERRSEIARNAARARWGTPRPEKD